MMNPFDDWEDPEPVDDFTETNPFANDVHLKASWFTWKDRHGTLSCCNDRFREITEKRGAIVVESDVTGNRLRFIRSRGTENVVHYRNMTPIDEAVDQGAFRITVRKERR